MRGSSADIGAAIGSATVLILLPPSETKADGGDGAPLDLDALSFPELTAIRRKLADVLVRLAAKPELSQKWLGLSKSQLGEIDRNAALWTSGTRPAIERYTGVLYDAFDYASLTAADRTLVAERVGIGSALFGATRAADPIPGYRLSGGNKLPRLGTLGSQWKPKLTKVLSAADEVVVDLRSGAYQQLGPVPGAITVQVLTEAADGSRSVVSHFNKHHKGLVARSLATSPAAPATIDEIAKVVADGGQRVEIASDTQLVVLTD